MIGATLFDEFLTEECTPYVRDLLRAALEAATSGTGPTRTRFEFNRFELELDVDQGVVLLDDVLDAGTSGSQRIPMKIFSEALSRP
jgi:hypothetical protein